eukprot:TRINITY_DN3146_c1_g1_i2.p1 TRINITY_DN3146_c1_g1~~TRINITY_DN3146_c1_g1_i2.p1  ORF type:complete len:344 (+),score=70.46 TRINITY_DN3146_c1_g1_i2:152-1183(+)
MTSEEQETLFHRFSQVNRPSTHQSSYGGSGLGLFISKDLISLMGGQISVKSEQNKGSTFTFSIIVSTTCPPPPTASTTPPPPSAHHTPSSTTPSSTPSLSSPLLIVSQSSSLSLAPLGDRASSPSLTSSPSHVDTAASNTINNGLVMEYIVQSPSSSSSSSSSGGSSYATAAAVARPAPTLAAVAATAANSTTGMIKAKDDVITTGATSLVPRRILIVEDNILNQKVLRRHLTAAGHTCVVANNGQEAIDALEPGFAAGNLLAYFDVIFMDLEMPVMNGRDATRIIRQRERERGVVSTIVIIGLSGNARQSQIEGAMELGMQHFIVKPYNKLELLNLIESSTM